jgi:hypothetical protein
VILELGRDTPQPAGDGAYPREYRVDVGAAVVFPGLYKFVELCEGRSSGAGDLLELI